jgi:general secretion pathway protein E
MGVERHVLTSTLSCVLAQRLVRKLCSDCADKNEAVGCPACNFTGYSGRQVFGEFLAFEDAMRSAVRSGKDRVELEKAALACGLVSLAERGKRLVEKGVTTDAELRRVMGS